MGETQHRVGISSTETEDSFRQIFFAHLESDGYTEADAHQLIFKTPGLFHEVPSSDHGLGLLDAFRKSYAQQLAYAWFFEGLNQEYPADPAWLKAPARPVTFVVIPGIFGEFIDQLPFQSAIEGRDSHFYKKWQAALQQVNDQAYSLTSLQETSCCLSDLVKIGSIDQGERSFANVIVLRAKSGSLETLGSLASNAEVFRSRLTKLFEVIDDDSDIYLLGYSRGLAVALELVSSLHEQANAAEIPASTRAWFKRIKGVVGLGGVFYGAHFAQDVLTGQSGATSDLFKLLRHTSGILTTIPDDAKFSEKRKILAGNAKAWAEFVKQVSAARTVKVAAGKTFLRAQLEEIFAKESKARIMGRDAPVPNPWGIFSLVNNFLLKTFNLKRFVSRYNENVLAFKQLVESVVIGLHTLTPEARDQWWQNHQLPDDLALFSITGSMPDAHLNDFQSPLWHFDGFGTRTSDYNVSLRANYYDVLASENTQINDSQMSHFSSRYWPQMYPEHQYVHYYLGILGTHHWGMAFPFTIKDKTKIGGNAFPRETLLKSVASFILSLDCDQTEPMNRNVGI